MDNNIKSISNINSSVYSAEFLKKISKNFLNSKDFNIESNFFKDTIDEYWENPDIDNESKKNPSVFASFLAEKLNLKDNGEYMSTLQKAADYIADSDNDTELTEEDFYLSDEQYYLQYETDLLENSSDEVTDNSDNENDDVHSKDHGLWLLDTILYRQSRPLSTAFIFMDNQQKLKEDTKVSKLDKYYHARANAQAGQRFDIAYAVTLSFGREVWDILRKNTWEKNPNNSFEDVLDDSFGDIQADIYGLYQGLTHPFSDVDSILDVEWLRSLKD